MLTPEVGNIIIVDEGNPYVMHVLQDEFVWIRQRSTRATIGLAFGVVGALAEEGIRGALDKRKKPLEEMTLEEQLASNKEYNLEVPFTSIRSIEIKKKHIGGLELKMKFIDRKGKKKERSGLVEEQLPPEGTREQKFQHKVAHIGELLKDFPQDKIELKNMTSLK